MENEILDDCPACKKRKAMKFMEIKYAGVKRNKMSASWKCIFCGYIGKVVTILE